jgi:hypothetical protein
VDLLVAVRVQEHQVGLIVHAASSPWQNVMDMPSGLLGDRLAAVGTSSFLCLPEAKQSFSPFEAFLHDQTEPLFEGKRLLNTAVIPAHRADSVRP